MKLHVFADRSACEKALAERLALLLAQALLAKKHAYLALAGGSSPQGLYRLLAEQVDTARCVITPTDERWVEAGSELSNGRLLGECLPKARLILPPKTPNIVQDAQHWQQSLSALPCFDVCLLGMGEDGHIASIFADMPELEQALDLNTPPQVLVGLGSSEPRSRLTLNLNFLLNSHWLGLLAFGEAKRALLEQASKALVPALPVQALFEQKVRPVEVFWAP